MKFESKGTSPLKKFSSAVSGSEAADQVVQNILETKKMGGKSEGEGIDLTVTDIAMEALNLLNAGSIIEIVEKVKASGVFQVSYNEE